MTGLFTLRWNKECRFALQLRILKTNLYTIFLFHKILTESTAYRKHQTADYYYSIYIHHTAKNYRKKNLKMQLVSLTKYI